MVRLEGYTLGDALGEGAFAVCRLGHKTGEPNNKVAVKSLMRDHPNFDPESLASEIKIMKAINHPRCISLIEVREDSAAVHLVEELAGGGFCVGVPCGGGPVCARARLCALVVSCNPRGAGTCSARKRAGTHAVGEVIASL